jgi:hypothetical protein
MILLALLATGMLGKILGPLLGAMQVMLFSLAGLK